MMKKNNNNVDNIMKIEYGFYIIFKRFMFDFNWVIFLLNSLILNSLLVFKVV